MPITFKRAGQEAVTIENVSFKGVALDKVTFKRAGQEAVTVFENVTEDALAGTWVFNNTLSFNGLNIPSDGLLSFSFMFESGNPTALGTLNVFDGIKFSYASVYDIYSLVYNLHIEEGNSVPEPIDGNYYYSKSVPDEGIVAGWGDDAYKTITITSKLSEVTNGDQLLAWLQANATKQ